MCDEVIRHLNNGEIGNAEGRARLRSDSPPLQALADSIASLRTTLEDLARSTPEPHEAFESVVRLINSNKLDKAESELREKSQNTPWAAKLAEGVGGLRKALQGARGLSGVGRVVRRMLDDGHLTQAQRAIEGILRAGAGKELLDTADRLREVVRLIKWDINAMHLAIDEIEAGGEVRKVRQQLRTGDHRLSSKGLATLVGGAGKQSLPDLVKTLEADETAINDIARLLDDFQVDAAERLIQERFLPETALPHATEAVKEAQSAIAFLRELFQAVPHGPQAANADVADPAAAPEAKQAAVSVHAPADVPFADIDQVMEKRAKGYTTLSHP